MTQKEKHEKAIRLIDAIDFSTNSLFGFEEDLKIIPKEFHKHIYDRIEVTTKVRTRLINYYKNSFTI